METCDICGYEHNLNVQEYPDGVFRCLICRDKAVFGRYIPRHEMLKAPKKQVDKWNKMVELWINSLEIKE